MTGELVVRAPRERRFVPVLVLVAIVVAVLAGGYLVAGALSEPEGPPVTVAGVVRVAPLSGWEVARRSGAPAGVLLTRGTGNLAVSAVPFDGTSHELVAWWTAHVLEPATSQLSVSSDDHVTVASGLRGTRISYVGAGVDRSTSIEGQLTAVVSPSGIGIVFNGWAPKGLLPYVVADVDRMVVHAEVLR